MLRKNVAGQHFCFVLLNASTGAALPGATVSAYTSIDGAAQAAATGTVTETANGQYSFAPSQADTNGNQIGYLFTAASALPININVVTTAANPTDGTHFGLSSLPNASAGAANGLPTLDGSGHELVYSVSQGVTVSTNNDKTGYSLSVTPPTAAAIATAVWTDTTAGDFTVASSPGKAIISGGVPVTGNVTVGGYASGQDPATLVLDVAASSHNTANSIGAKVNSAGSAGDPWSTTIPGAYSAGQAGYIVGHNLDTTVGSRSTYAGGAVASVTAAVTVATNNDKAGYSLSAAGLDQVVAETGINLRQAVSVILAGAAGVVSGAGTGAVRVNSAGSGNTERIAATVDASGDRTGVTLTLPT